jgi:hypothetical protein
MHLLLVEDDIHALRTEVDHDFAPKPLRTARGAGSTIQAS